MDEWVDYLVSDWGLNRAFAAKIYACLYNWYVYGYNFTITSGFRDPEKQLDLLKRWNSGDRRGLAAKPAKNSKHSVTSWGFPSALAIDIVLDRYDRDTKYIANYFDVKWGGDFRHPDVVHWYV